jgi:hypothetical protein
LKQCDEVPLDGTTARASGRLCGQTDTADVIDASVAVTVANSINRGAEVVLLTSDGRDLRMLLTALSANARVVEV